MKILFTTAQINGDSMNYFNEIGMANGQVKARY